AVRAGARARGRRRRRSAQRGGAPQQLGQPDGGDDERGGAGARREGSARRWLERAIRAAVSPRSPSIAADDRRGRRCLFHPVLYAGRLVGGRTALSLGAATSG